MSNYPESADVFTDKAASDAISSSDPNAAYDAIEATQGLIGALGKAQSWSTTLLTLLRQYRRGLEVEVSGGVLYVRKGEAVLENTNAALYAFRRNPTDHTVLAANLDAGTLAVNTYYMYAWGGTVATTAPIIFSTNAVAPANIGTAPYRQLGYFWNEAAGALAVTYVSGGDTSIQRKDVYNSGWFAIIPNTTYPLIHNLGTINFLHSVLWSTNADGSNAEVDNYDEVSMIERGMQIKGISTTQLVLQVAHDYTHMSLLAGTYEVSLGGYAKVTLLALD